MIGRPDIEALEMLWISVRVLLLVQYKSAPHNWIQANYHEAAFTVYIPDYLVILNEAD